MLSRALNKALYFAILELAKKSPTKYAMYHYVYFLRSSKDGNFYIGCTSLDPKVRLDVHNSGTVRSTKSRRPLELIHFEKFTNKSEAFKREFYLKSPKGYLEKKRDNIAGV